LEYKIRIVDEHCPICGSNRVRSKVGDKWGWWYICDNRDDSSNHKVMFEGMGVIDLGRAYEGRFYWLRRKGKVYLEAFSRLWTPTRRKYVWREVK
jgi:hypothetical protein